MPLTNAMKVHEAVCDMWLRYCTMMAPPTRAFGKNGREKVVTKAQINNLHTGLSAAIVLAKDCGAFPVDKTNQLLQNFATFRMYAMHLAQSRRNGLTASGPGEWVEQAARSVTATLYLIREDIWHPPMSDVEQYRGLDNATFNGIEIGGEL